MLGTRLVMRAGASAAGASGLAVLVWVLASAPSVRAQDDLHAAVVEFWLASSSEGRSAAAGAILAADATFDEVAFALRGGRVYSSDVETGRQVLRRQNADGLEHAYVAFIPESYDPSKSYPVWIYLHGGVMRPKRDDGGWWRNPDPFMRSDAIIVFPESWPDSLWWQRSQIENLGGLLNDLKRVYNVDENRAYLLGMSDGATGAFYQAFKATTPWAAFLPFHGHPGVLANPSSDVDGELHVTNLQNKPFFIVNGGQDRLYPLASVAPFVELFQRAGVPVEFRPLPEAGHNMQWWPDLAPGITSFVQAAPRQPLPDQLSWQTESADMFNRAHWLVINEIGRVEGQSELEPHNMLTRRVPDAQLGISSVGELVDRSGIQLFEIGADSIVDAAGMQTGDVILSIDGQPTPDPDALREALIGFAPGDELAVAVGRDGEMFNVAWNYPTTFITQARGAFQHGQMSGRVDLSRDGNTVTALTEGVRRYTLLLSPDQFDFSKPITVVTNGVVSHDGMVTPDVETLVGWASVDQDRTLLFGAELEIEVVAPVAR